MTSSVNEGQQSHFSGCSGNREKLDGLSLVESASSQDTRNMVDVLGQMDHEGVVESKCNLRKSLAWDRAFFTSPGVLEPEEFWALNSSEMGMVSILGNEEDILLSSQALEPERTREVRAFNYRKSLAWDNAFFTSAGVLDPEELSIVNRGLKKCETHLPGIDRKLWRSTESNYTIDSESSSLTSLEMDLFEDIRASMPNHPTRASNMFASFRLEREAVSKTSNAPSRLKMKTMPVSRRQSTNAGTERIKRPTSVTPPTQLKRAAENGDSHTPTSLKPPKGANLTSSASTKRTNSTANREPSRTGKAASVQCLRGSKKPCLRGDVISSSTSLLKASSLAHVAGDSVSCSPRSMYFRAAPITGKSPSNLNSRKVDSRRLPAIGPTFTTPLRHSKGKKLDVENSNQPPGLLSTPKSSSHLSPARSLDNWSSSTSAAQRSTNYNAILENYKGDVSFKINVSSSNLDSHLDEEICDGRENQPSQHEKGILTGQDAKPIKVSRKIGSSGLRMPSPKIGFFEEGRMPVSTVERQLQLHSGVRSRLSKFLSSVTNPVAPHRAKHSKHSLFRQSQNHSLDTANASGTNVNAEKVGFASISSSIARERGISTRKPTVALRKSNQKPPLEEPVIRRRCPKNDPHIFHDDNKENVYGFGDQIEELRRHVCGLDLDHDLVMELTGNRNCQTLLGTNNSDK